MAESLHLVIDQWIQFKLGNSIYTTLRIKPRTYSYPRRISYHDGVCWYVQYG